jgi:hypothetical protein
MLSASAAADDDWCSLSVFAVPALFSSPCLVFVSISRAAEDADAYHVFVKLQTAGWGLSKPFRIKRALLRLWRKTSSSSFDTKDDPKRLPLAPQLATPPLFALALSPPPLPPPRRRRPKLSSSSFFSKHPRVQDASIFALRRIDDDDADRPPSTKKRDDDDDDDEKDEKEEEKHNGEKTPARERASRAPSSAFWWWCRMTICESIFFCRVVFSTSFSYTFF